MNKNAWSIIIILIISNSYINIFNIIKGGELINNILGIGFHILWSIISVKLIIHVIRRRKDINKLADDVYKFLEE